MAAAGAVLMLALALVLVVASSPSLSDRTKWFLLLLALVAGTLAALRWLGTL
jgi:hypothetical protein